MKTKIIVLLLIISTTSFAQSAKLNNFFHKYKHRPNTIAMALPGWLVKIGLTASGEQEEMKNFKPLLKGLSSIKLLVMEDKNYASPAELKALVSHAKEHDFQELVAVKDGNERVNILLREQKNKKKLIKNIMILVAEEDELVLVTLNGRWKPAFLHKILQEQEIDFRGGLVGVN